MILIWGNIGMGSEVKVKGRGQRSRLVGRGKWGL